MVSFLFIAMELDRSHGCFEKGDLSQLPCAQISDCSARLEICRGIDAGDVVKGGNGTMTVHAVTTALRSVLKHGLNGNTAPDHRQAWSGAEL
jgi:hypothetical protein